MMESQFMFVMPSGSTAVITNHKQNAKHKTVWIWLLFSSLGQNFGIMGLNQKSKYFIF